MHQKTRPNVSFLDGSSKYLPSSDEIPSSEELDKLFAPDTTNSDMTNEILDKGDKYDDDIQAKGSVIKDPNVTFKNREQCSSGRYGDHNIMCDSGSQDSAEEVLGILYWILVHAIQCKFQRVIHEKQTLFSTHHLNTLGLNGCALGYSWCCAGVKIKVSRFPVA